MRTSYIPTKTDPNPPLSQVYFWATIRKLKPNYHPSRGIQEEKVCSIIQRDAIIEKDAALAHKNLLALPGLAKYQRSLRTQDEQEHFQRHLRKYVNIYLPECPFEVCTTNRYTITTHEASVIARRRIRQGEEIKYLSGIQVEMTEQEEKELSSRTDFSIVISSRRKRPSLFLGPARFANHDCESNAKLSTSGKHGIHIVAKRSIDIGEEITVTYGESYFGIDNCECLCASCEKGVKNGWDPKGPILPESDSEDGSEDEEDEDAKVSGSLKRKRGDDNGSAAGPRKAPKLGKRGKETISNTDELIVEAAKIMNSVETDDWPPTPDEAQHIKDKKSSLLGWLYDYIFEQSQQPNSDVGCPIEDLTAAIVKEGEVMEAEAKKKWQLTGDMWALTRDLAQEVPSSRPIDAPITAHLSAVLANPKEERATMHATRRATLRSAKSEVTTDQMRDFRTQIMTPSKHEDLYDVLEVPHKDRYIRGKRKSWLEDVISGTTESRKRRRTEPKVTDMFAQTKSSKALGKMPATKPKVEETDLADASIFDFPESPAPVVPVPVKRGRGRPRKHPLPVPVPAPIPAPSREASISANEAAPNSTNSSSSSSVFSQEGRQDGSSQSSVEQSPDRLGRFAKGSICQNIVDLYTTDTPGDGEDEETALMPTDNETTPKGCLPSTRKSLPRPAAHPSDSQPAIPSIEDNAPTRDEEGNKRGPIRQPSDHHLSTLLLTSPYHRYVECRNCDEHFLQAEAYLTRIACPRCERHSKLYGYYWPKTERDGKWDTEERVTDHRTIHRFIEPEEERNERKGGKRGRRRKDALGVRRRRGSEGDSTSVMEVDDEEDEETPEVVAGRDRVRRLRDGGRRSESGLRGRYSGM